jgi:hypothetical protein
MRNNATQAILNAAYADRQYAAFVAMLNVRTQIGPIRRKVWAQAVYALALSKGKCNGRTA